MPTSSCNDLRTQGTVLCVHTTWHTLDARVVYAEGENSPCAVMFENNEYLFVRNIWGDIVAVIDANTGNTLVNYSYDAWGNITYTFNSSLSTEEKLFLRTLCAFTYRGYNYDFDTELYYLQSRFYNPYWGRFLNVDDTAILLSSVGQIKGANLFIYCGNNPVNMVDPSGYAENTNELIKVVIIGFFIAQYYKDYISPSIKIMHDEYCLFGVTYKTNVKVDRKLYDAIALSRNIDKELTYRILAIMADMRIADFYDDENNNINKQKNSKRHFLFSEECISHEIKTHYEIYSYLPKFKDSTAEYYKGILDGTTYYPSNPNSNSFDRLSSMVVFSHEMEEHVKDIDINESDVYYEKQCSWFNYFDGLRSCYNNFYCDPFRNESNNVRVNEVVPWSRTGWIKELNRYGKYN